MSSPKPPRHAGAGERPDPLEELVGRTVGLQPWRRVFHAASGVALALGPGLLRLERGPLLGGLTVLLALAVLLDVARLRVRRINVAFFRLLSALASPREAGGLASSTWYVLSALLLWSFTPSRAAPALLVLALADPAAGVVGRLWGRRRLGKGSVEGAAAFFVVSSTVLLVAVGGWAAVVVAFAVTAVEVLPQPVDDNLSVPLGTAAALALLGR